MSLTDIVLNNRYFIEDHLAAGGMSDIYRAVDKETGGAIALKVLRKEMVSGRIEDLIRFHTVLETVKNLHHPNIVEIHDYGFSDDSDQLHFMVMELVEGLSLQDLLQQVKALSVNEAIDIALQICIALDAVHGRGIIHGDLKPGNVLVCTHDTRSVLPLGKGEVTRSDEGGCSPEKWKKESVHIKLIDFGLSRMRDFGTDVNSDYITGTFRYIPPEQSGIIRQPVDERSDLYSLGLILFLMLTGEMPFQEQSLVELLHQQAAKVPVPPSSRNKNVPPMMDEILHKLLQKEPEKRYQSAKGLIHDLRLVSEGEKEFRIGSNDKALRLDFFTEMIGRKEELGLMKGMLADIGAGGRLCIIAGESGIGKSRLADEFRKEALKAGITYIEGRAFDRKNKVPFGPIRDAVSDYINQYRRYPDERKKVIAERVLVECYDLGRMIVNFNPRTGELLGQCPEVVPLEPEREIHRFYLILARFIRSVAEAEGGIVLMLEDMHWADEGSLKLLEELGKSIKETPHVIVIAFRNNELGDKHLLNDLAADTEAIALQVKGFSIGEMREMVDSLYKLEVEDADRLAGTVMRSSSGNPFFAIEILKQIVDSGVITREGDSWALDKKKLNEIGIPENVIETILKGIEDLSPFERLIITRASVIGRTFALDMLFDFKDAGLGQGMKAMEGVLAAIEKAAEKGLVEEDYLELGRYSFVHDRVRDAFYGSLGKKDRKALHLQVGLIYEEKYKNNQEQIIFDLAGHFIEAGNVDKIKTYAYAAAILARDNYAYTEALHYFQTVKGVIEKDEGFLAEEHMRELWIKCMESIGVLHTYTGNPDDALTHLEKLLPHVSDKIKKANLYLYMSRALFRKGDFKGCEGYVKVGLKLLGEWLPTTKAAVLAGSIKEMILFFVWRLIPARKNKRDVEKYKMIIWFYDCLNWAYFFSEGYKLIRIVFRMFNIAERRIGYSKELVYAYYYFSFSCIISGLMNTAYTYILKATDIANQFGDLNCIAKMMNGMAFFWGTNKDYYKSIGYCKAEIDLLEKIGDRVEMNIATHLITFICNFIGDYHNATYYHQRYKSYATDILDELTNMAGEYPSIYYIETGQYEVAEAFILDLISKARKVNAIYNLYVLLSYIGYLYYETGRLEEAIKTFEEAHAIEKSEMLPPHYRNSHYFYSNALIQDYRNRVGGLNSRDKKQYLRKIKKFSRLSIKNTKTWGYYYGTALRYSAMYCDLTGNIDKAGALFDESAAWSKGIGRRYEHARTLYEYGLFLRDQYREAEAWQRLTESYRIFDEIGAPPYKEKIAVLLGLDAKTERVDTLAELVRREKLALIAGFAGELSALRKREDLLDAVLTRSMELVGARNACLFLSKDIDEKPVIMAARHLDPEKEDEYSFSIVQRVFDSGEPVLTTNAELEKEFNEYRSVALYGLKSVICIPVRHNDLVNGALYMDNKLAAGLFSEGHITLLETFLSSVAICIENMLLRERLRESEKKRTGGKKKPHDPNLAAALDYIEMHFTEDLVRQDMADDLGISPDYLGKIFKQHTGKTVRDYLNELRVQKAAELLSDSDTKIIDIAFMVGFESLRTFYRIFYRVMGETPTDFRGRGKEQLE